MCASQSDLHLAAAVCANTGPSRLGRYVATLETPDAAKPEEPEAGKKGSKNQLKKMNKLQKQLKNAKEQNQNLQRGISRLKGDSPAGKGGTKRAKPSGAEDEE